MGEFCALVMGCSGGPWENNLSGYLLYPSNDPNQLIALDAGTLLGGLNVIHARNHLQDFTFVHQDISAIGEVLLHKIKAYLISHVHLDHIAGLVSASSIKQSTYVIGTQTTIDYLKEHVFNGVVWPNCANEGKSPYFSHYKYLCAPLESKIVVPNTEFSVEAFVLSHPHDYRSTAFFIEHQDSVILYFGDTSPDRIEQTKRLAHVWQHAAPMVRTGKLKGIFLECSYLSQEVEKIKHGHINSNAMIEELTALQNAAGTSLKGLKVVVTHRKDSFSVHQNHSELIAKELTELNTLGIHFIFPKQGDRIIF